MNIRALAKTLILRSEARNESLRDMLGIPAADPGIDPVIDAVAQWILLAQARSSSRDGGVAAHYSLKTGWSSSYPETTGYIVPTLLDVARRRDDEVMRRGAERMLDWLVSIQFADGSFQGGNIDAQPCLPTVFNTGQILFGLVAGVAEFGDRYAAPMRAAASWLVANQDEDGAWRKFRSPFTSPGPKAYETHVAWALLEADKVTPGLGYAEAAIRNIHWAISQQLDNGWFDNCGLGAPETPLTHTIGYALRGIVEGWIHSPDPRLLDAALRCASALADKVQPDGRLTGRLDRNWNDASGTVCLTGSAQIAHSFLLLHKHMGAPLLLRTARAMNRYVRQTIRIEGPEGIRGGVKGSFPTSGDYGPFRYLNWAAKFTIDSLIEEASHSIE